MASAFSVSGSVCVLLLIAGVSACKNQAPPAAEATAAEPTTQAPAAAAAATAGQAEPAAAAAPSALSKYSEAGFDLELQPKGAYTSGQPGEAEIVLVAKAPFHVNEKYPYKFKISDTPGLKFEKLIVAKDAVKLEPARATVPVAFTPASAGKHTIAGQLSFSVCTEDKCMIEKRELALEIEAK